MKWALIIFPIRSFKRKHSYGLIPPPNGNTIHLALRSFRLNRGTWGGSLEPMSRQIKVRHFGCSQLGEDTFKNGYWVTHSRYGTWECGGVPKQWRVSSPQPSPLWLPLWKVQESQPQHGGKNKFVFYSLVLGLLLEDCQGWGVIRYSSSLYIDRGFPPPRYLPFRVHLTCQITKASELKTLPAATNPWQMCLDYSCACRHRTRPEWLGSSLIFLFYFL